MSKIDDLTARRVAKGTPAIMKLDNAMSDGWPELFQVEGNVKCLLCQGAISNQPICWECHDIITTLRAHDNFANLKRLLVAISAPEFLLVFEALTSDLAAEILMRRLTGND